MSSTKVKMDVPCPKCGGDRYFLRTMPNGYTQKSCLDCKAARARAVRRDPSLIGTGKSAGSTSRSAKQLRDVKVVQLLGSGLPKRDVIEQSGLCRQTVERVVTDLKTDPVLLAHFKRAQEEAATKVLPLAQKAAIMALERGIHAMEHGVEQSVGFDKTTGEPVMRKIKPNLQHLSSFARDTSNIIGVGKGSIASTDAEIEQHEVRKTVAGQLNWNDPAVLEAAMKIAAGIAHDRAPANALSARREDD